VCTHDGLGSMTRWVLLTAFLLVLLVGSLSQFVRFSEAQTQESAKPLPTASVISPTEVAVSDTATTPALQCQGCHGTGKTLPYLGGGLFHTGPHRDYDRGFHALSSRNGAKGATCLDCHAKNGDLTTILPAIDPKSTINRATIAETCGKCHGDKSVMQGSGISDRPFLSYRESVHAEAIARGNTSAAVCTDCHNSHDIQPASNSQSSIAKANIPATCGRCHQTEAREFIQSVHGQAVTRGVSRAPACTDCHGIHNIKTPSDQTNATASVAVATESCAKCHEGVTLTQEFGVAGGRVSSYKDSYHGLASRLGARTVANCASCHGVHNILPSSDPRSMISANNLQQTCGQCHIGAGVNFTRGRIHLEATAAATETVSGRDLGTIGTRWVKRIYVPLIVLTIGGMVIHNFLIWRRKALAKRKLENRTVVRLTSNQRLQHWLLLSSFILLVLSGFALQYPDSWLALLLGANEPLRRALHRIAAVVMLCAGVYHVAYLMLTREGKEWVRDMWPRVKDARDLIQNLGYYLGVRTERPKVARFGYPEKAEYWAVVWGTLIMGLTGLMIWFKLGFFSFLPRWMIDVALAVHFYEAVLATLAIVVWHFYHVIFDPDVYPINWAFYDGRMSEELYREEHALAYEQNREEETHKTSEAVGGPEPSSPETPAD
jgi:formate dehydrogenase gamma subunit